MRTPLPAGQVFSLDFAGAGHSEGDFIAVGYYQQVRSLCCDGPLEYSRALSGTLGYSRVLSGTLGYDSVLSGTLGYNRVTLGYSPQGSAHGPTSGIRARRQSAEQL